MPRQKSKTPATDCDTNWPQDRATGTAQVPRWAKHNTSGSNQYSGPTENWNPQQDNWAPPCGLTAP